MPYEPQVNLQELTGTCAPEDQSPALADQDPRRLLLTLPRYKFVSKALAGRANVLEVGVGDTFASSLVRQEIPYLTTIDPDQTVVDAVLRRADSRSPFECRRHDLLSGPFPRSFEAAYAMDVIERIPAAQEDVFVGNIVRSLTPDGVLIVGSQAMESQSQTPVNGRSGHRNRKSARGLRTLMERYFHSVLLFSMNEEALHMGVVPMAQYHIAVGCNPRQSAAPVRSVLVQGTGTDEAPLDLTIVVPCLNEQYHIGPTLDTIVAAMLELPFSYEVIVVDDGSTDDTSKTVGSYIEAHPGLPIRLIKHATNRGLSTSYVDAAFVGRGTYYRLVCGDNAEPKEGMIKVLQHLGTAQMVIPYYSAVTGKSGFRLWLSGTYTAIVNALSGHRLRYYNGLAVHLRYNVMRWGPYSFGFGFQAELITRLLDEGTSYVEVPIQATHRDKDSGSSALNIRNFLSVVHTILEIFIRRVRKRALGK